MDVNVNLKVTNYHVIIYPPSCHFKPVRFSAQKKVTVFIYAMKCMDKKKSSLVLHRRKT